MNPYLGRLTSGAPDLEREKTEKRKQKEEEKKVIKGTGRKKALSQGWTAVCDRHPGADSDVRVQIKGKKKREKRLRERDKETERVGNGKTSKHFFE